MAKDSTRSLLITKRTEQNRYWILTTLCLAAIIAYLQRLGFNTAEEEVRDSLEITTQETGTIMSAWFLGYAIMQIPSGWLADRWGSRRTLAVIAIAWSILTAAAAFAPNFPTLLMIWFTMGLAQAGIFPCATKAIGAWFPDDQRAFASGMLASAMAAGVALAPALTGELLTVLDWRIVVGLYALPGLAWVVLFLSTVSEPPQEQSLAHGGTREVLRGAIRSLPIWMLCAQQFFRAAAMVFFMTWFPTFLRATRGVDLKTSGYLTGAAGVGALLGGLLGGISSDALLRRTGRRRLARQGIAVFGMSGCAVLITAAYFVESIPVAIGMTSLGTFLAAFGGVSGYTVAIELGGRGVATVFSLMNMFGNIGAFIFPIVVGAVVAAYEQAGQAAEGWTLVLFLCALIFLLDAVCWALLNPKTNVHGEPL